MHMIDRTNALLAAALIALIALAMAALPRMMKRRRRDDDDVSDAPPLSTLQEIGSLLKRHRALPKSLATALRGSEAEQWAYLVSNDLWGGSGSIADSALLGWLGGSGPRRWKLESLMIRLGNAQIRRGHVNVRTQWWVETFEKWKREGVA